MRITNINKGIKGTGLIQERALRFKYMIQEEANRRARALTFWRNHGIKATMDAYNVSRACTRHCKIIIFTLYKYSVY